MHTAGRGDGLLPPARTCPHHSGMIRLPIRNVGDLTIGASSDLDTGASERPARHALAWAGLGFLAGVLFWHTVGFWQFLSDAVLKEGRAAVAHHEPPASTVASQRPRVAVTSPAPQPRSPCVALQLDRRSGTTASLPCHGRQWHFRHTGPTPRQDLDVRARALASGGEGQVAGWSATVAGPMSQIATPE